MQWTRGKGLLLLGTVALAVRLACIAAVGEATSGPVTYEHGEIAANLLAGRGFSCRFLGSEGPTSQQAPLYPVLLAGSYWLFGQTYHALLAMQLLQAVVGAATVLMTARIGWSLVPDKPAVGWLAAWLLALYPPHVYMVTHVQVATLATFLLTAAAMLAADTRLARSWPGAPLAGVACGLMLLVDPIMALAVPWLVLMRLPRGALAAGVQPWAQAAVLVGTCIIVLAPWIVRNYRVHGELVFVKSTLGYAFWQGNNPRSLGTDKVPQPAAKRVLEGEHATLAETNRRLWAARHKTLYIDDVALTPADYRQLAQLSEPRRSAELGRRAMEFIRRDPAAYVRLCSNRLRFFLFADETNPKASHPLYRWSSLVWLVLASLGGLAAGRSWKRLWPLAGIVATLVVFHTLVISSSRFRMPLEPLTLVWAAAGVLALATALLRLFRVNRFEHAGAAVPG